MGTEAVVPLFGPVLLLCLVVLAVMAIRRGTGDRLDERTLGLGRERIAAGYLGALGVALAIAAWLMKGQLEFGLQSGNYPPSKAAAYAVDLLLFYFVTTGLLVLVVLSVVGLPTVALLRRVRAASTLGVALAGLLFGCIMGLLVSGAMVEFVVSATLVALGFAVAARLPLLRS